MNNLLHGQNIRRIPLLGAYMERRFAGLVEVTRQLTAQAKDPDVSIVIRAKNHDQQLETLLGDIKQQVFSGQIEIIVVDTESQDRTVAIAKKFGAKVISISQAEFTYPKALNLGFEAATKPWVIAWVDHSTLPSRYVLKSVTRWHDDQSIGGIWAWLLPGANASFWERLGYIFWIWKAVQPARETLEEKPSMGYFGGNDLAVRREIWQELGGFDERYAAGGEDYVFGQAVRQAGHRVIRDPSMAICHSHGLGLLDSLRQFRYWMRLGQPRAFDYKLLRRYRSDL